MRYFAASSAFFAALFFLASAVAAEPPSLADLVREALENNPEIRAAAANRAAMQERPSQEGALPNPALTLGLVNVPTDSFDLDQEAMTQKTIGVMQTFPWPGKRGLKREIAEQESIRSGSSLELLRLKVAREVKETYYALYLADRSTEVTERNHRILEDFIRIAETKYAVGGGIQQDVLKAYVELSKMNERLILLNERREVLSARMNYLLNRPGGGEIETAQEADGEHREIPPESLLSRIDEAHPALKEMAALVAQAEGSNRLARKGYYPDLSVTLQYGQRDDGAMERADFLSALVKMDLPVWQGVKEDRKVAETAARTGEARARYEAARSRIVFQIRMILSEMESALEQARLYREGILPQARASLESAVAGYQVNKVDFLTLLNNHLTLFNYEIEYYRSLATHGIKMAALEEAAGGSLTIHDHEVPK